MTRTDSGWILENTERSSIYSTGSAWGAVRINKDTGLYVYKSPNKEITELSLGIEYDIHGELEYMHTELSNHQVRSVEDLLELCRLLGVTKDD